MAEQADVLPEGRIAPVIWARPVFAFTLRNRGLDRAYQIRPTLALARAGRHGVHDLRYAIERAVEEPFALKGLQLLIEQSRRVRPAVRQPQTGLAHGVVRHRLVDRVAKQRLDLHEQFFRMRQCQIELPEIRGRGTRRFPIALVSRWQTWSSLHQQRQCPLCEAVHRPFSRIALEQPIVSLRYGGETRAAGDLIHGGTASRQDAQCPRQ